MAAPLFAAFDTSSEDETAQLARQIAPLLGAGDVLLLDGPIGSGKTCFARALIQERLSRDGRHEDVPSPTYTLIQTYWDGEVEIWHADLYRLSVGSDCEELGLGEAFDTAICLVEWPDRLGGAAPSNALELRFELGAETGQRRITLSGDRAIWDRRLGGLAGTRAEADAE